MMKNNNKCGECAFNTTWMHFKGCPFAFEDCDGKKMFKPKHEPKEERKPKVIGVMNEKEEIIKIRKIR